jgi:hypothetical protein
MPSAIIIEGHVQGLSNTRSVTKDLILPQNQGL